MPRFAPKRQEQITAQMIAHVVARSGLSDVGDTSVIKHILTAAARQDDEQYYQMTLLLELFSIDSASGEDLDERAKDIQPGTLTRIAANKATGTVVFSRTGTSGTVVIPIGTKVKTAGGKVFSTTTQVSITPTSPEQVAGHGVGRDSDLAAVIADEAGADGNVVANTVIKFVQKPVGVDEVTNLSLFSNGTDEETDDAFRARLKAFVASLARSTVQALEFGVLGIQDETSGATVLYSKVVEDIVNLGNVTVYVDDGTGSAESVEVVSGENVTEGLLGPPADTAVGGETELYLNYRPIKDTQPFTLTSSTRGVLVRDTDYILNPASGQILLDPPLVTGEQIDADYTRYTGLIALAQKVIDGDPNDRTNYPGLRAAGVLVKVLTPQVLIQNVEATITVLEGYDHVEVTANARQKIKDFVNNLAISGDLLRSALIYQVMGVTGVSNMTLSVPATDIIVLDDQLIRTADPNIILS